MVGITLIAAPVHAGTAVGTIIGPPPVVTDVAVGEQLDEPTGMAVGPDGRMWLVGTGNDTIGRIGTDRQFEVDPTPGVGDPTAIVAGADGNLWITGRANDTIGRVDPADASVSAFPLIGLDDPYALTVGPDGNIWVAGRANDTVARVTAEGTVSVFPLPPGTGPRAIAAGGNGSIWLTGQANGTLVEVDPGDGTVLAVHPAPVASPDAMVALGDGDLWVLGPGPSQTMARVDATTGQGTVYPTPFRVHLMTLGADGHPYILGNGRLGRVDAADGSVTDISNGGPNEGSRALAAGPGGTIWTIPSNAEDVVWVRSTTGDYLDLFVTPGEDLCPAGDVEVGGDGELWASGGQVVARLSPEGTITARYPAPVGPLDGAPLLTLGGDGRLWGGGRNSTMVRIDTAGDFDVLPFAEPVFEISEGPNGSTWVIGGYSRVVRVATDDVVTPFDTWDGNPFTGVQQLLGITEGPDENMWVVGGGNDSIGRIDAQTGVVTAFPLAPLEQPEDLVAGPDGNLWVIGITSDSVARVDPNTGTVTGIFPAGVDAPLNIVVGADGNLWISGLNEGISRMDTSGVATTYPLAGPGNQLVSGPDGNLWMSTNQTSPDCHLRRIALASPAVSLAKVAAEPSVVAGEDAEWSITVRNTGDVGLRDVAVSDPSAPGCGGALADLGVGEETTVTCSTPTDDDDVGTITNEATVTADPELGLPVSATGSATVTVGATTTTTTSTTTTTTTTSTTIGSTSTTGPVGPPASEPPGAGPDDLARTGADVARLVGVGLVLIGLGVGVRGAVRRSEGRAKP